MKLELTILIVQCWSYATIESHNHVWTSSRHDFRANYNFNFGQPEIVPENYNFRNYRYKVPAPQTYPPIQQIYPTNFLRKVEPPNFVLPPPRIYIPKIEPEIWTGGVPKTYRFVDHYLPIPNAILPNSPQKFETYPEHIPNFGLPPPPPRIPIRKIEPGTNVAKTYTFVDQYLPTPNAIVPDFPPKNDFYLGPNIPNRFGPTNFVLPPLKIWTNVPKTWDLPGLVTTTKPEQVFNEFAPCGWNRNHFHYGGHRRNPRPQNGYKPGRFNPGPRRTSWHYQRHHNHGTNIYNYAPQGNGFVKTKNGSKYAFVFHNQDEHPEIVPVPEVPNENSPQPEVTIENSPLPEENPLPEVPIYNPLPEVPIENSQPPKVPIHNPLPEAPTENTQPPEVPIKNPLPEVSVPPEDPIDNPLPEVPVENLPLPEVPAGTSPQTETVTESPTPDEATKQLRPPEVAEETSPPPTAPNTEFSPEIATEFSQTTEVSSEISPPKTNQSEVAPQSEEIVDKIESGEEVTLDPKIDPREVTDDGEEVVDTPPPVDLEVLLL